MTTTALAAFTRWISGATANSVVSRPLRPAASRKRNPLFCENYERAAVRLVFLGLDPGEGSEWRSPCQRTPEAIQRKIQGGPPGKNPHWRGTLLLGVRILSACDASLEKLFRDLDCRTDGEKLQRLHEAIASMFAHANAVRCSTGKKGNKQASSILYSNCQRYLRKEIEILDPDVIVTQGRDSAKALQDSFAEMAPFERSEDRAKAKLVAVNGHQVLWLETCHPNAFGPFGREKGSDCWEPHRRAIRNFIEQFRKNLGVRPGSYGE